MLPLMFAVRKLDGEDPNIVFMLRCAYGSVQLLIMLAVLYIYMVATKLSKSKLKDEEIYVAPPPNVSLQMLIFVCVNGALLLNVEVSRVYMLRSMEKE